MPGDYLFFDLITTVVFGENFDLLRSSWYHYIPEALARSNERISVIVQFPYIVWRRLDKVLFRNSVAGRKDFLRFVHNLVTHRMKRSSGNDVFTSLLGAADPATGKKLSRDEIVAESILMLVAGRRTFNLRPLSSQAADGAQAPIHPRLDWLLCSFICQGILRRG
jgi:hypothetical protein